MLTAEIAKQEYEAGASTHTIAARYGIHPQTVYRLLKSIGVQLRNKSDAQKNALEKGCTQHPTKGRERSQEERENIRTGVKNWKKNQKS